MNNRIIQIRKHLNLTQDALGSKIGITRGAVSKIEKGERNVTEQVILAICREFNVNKEWLRTGEGSMFSEADTFSLDQYAKQQNVTELELDLLKTFMSLSKESRNEFIKAFQSTFFNYMNNEIVATEIQPTSDIPLPHNGLSSSQNEQIEKELILYRLELEAELKGKTSLVSEKHQIS